MFVSVDADQGVLEGFVYTNADGDPEKVVLHSNCVTVQESPSRSVTIYRKDITKLIMALQAADAHFVSQGD